MQQWPLHRAKDRFSEFVNSACFLNPQQLTRHGKPVAVLMSVKEYDTLKSLIAKLLKIHKAQKFSSKGPNWPES